MNEQNLIPFSERSENEARENGRKGGRASGASRRRKKALKATMRELLTMGVTDTELYNKVGAMGVPAEDITYQTALAAALLSKALDGDVAAFREIRDLIGESNDTERVKLARQKQNDSKGGKFDPVTINIAPRDDDGFIAALNAAAAEDWKEEAAADTE